MPKKKTYTADDIDVLNDREHVRLRTSVFLGSTQKTIYDLPFFTDDKIIVKPVEFVPATYKAIGEITDNSIDEFANAGTKSPVLTITAQPLLGIYTIADNGRGVPIDKHKTGKFTPEVVFAQSRSGRNFRGEREAGVQGQNGVGSACTNFCSTSFQIDITRDGKRYRQSFVDGALTCTKPSIRSSPATKSGTTISFELDTAVLDDTSLPADLLENRARELALLNPGLTVQYNKQKKFKFNKGLDALIKKNYPNDHFKFKSGDLEFYVLFNHEAGDQIFTWVNSSFLFEGGICNSQFLNAFTDRVISTLEKEAKKHKCTITRNDVKNDLLILGNLKLSDPQFTSQAKTRLTGPSLRKELDEMVSAQWTSFARKKKNWLTDKLQEIIDRQNTKISKKAKKDQRKNIGKKISGLVDATGTDRTKCQLLITEGDSAASMITDARDPTTTASLPSRGKINNVHGASIAQLHNMGKLTDVMNAIGLIPGQRAIRSTLRYGRVVIATDADTDGDDIFTLWINLFYQFWPDLFDPSREPFIYRLIAPNVCLTKGNQRVHFPSRAEYNKAKSKYKNWSVDYYKGLGSMVQEDWEMILSGKTDTFIPIVDDGNMKDTLELLFGPSASNRREWLQTDR